MVSIGSDCLQNLVCRHAFNALFVIPASLTFFSIGTALYVFYKQQPQLLNPGVQVDAIFPWFIVNQMPAGLSGLVVAGLFAAGQSGAQNSVATAIVTDFYRRFRPHAEEERCLRLARHLTLLLGVIAVSTAALIATYSVKSLWDVFLTILGLFGGSLAGVFALGIFTRRAHAAGALIGIATSVATLVIVQNFTRIHFFLYAGIGIITCFAAGYLASLITPGHERNLAGLTIYTLALGIERRRHFGLTRDPVRYRQSHKTFFKDYRPQAGKWYKVQLTQDQESIRWALVDRETGRVLITDRCYTSYDGNFIALGTLRAKASFR